MAIKTYRLNQRKNSISFTLTGKTGNVVRYDFTGGNVLTHTPAKAVLANEYYQTLLEGSDIYKKGYVKLESTASDSADSGTHQAAPTLMAVNDVSTVTQAVDYIADNFGVAVKTARQAREYANSKGIDFPNLKTGKQA